MKIFFCSSPRAKEKYGENIKRIYDLLKELGYQHTSDFIKDVKANEFYSENKEIVKKNYKEMVNGIKTADVVIFEASLHSLAVGYLVNLALEQGKAVVVLHTESSPAFLFENIQNDRLLVTSYKLENLKEILLDIMDEAERQVDVRFNFFIPPRIIAYLDWIAKNKKLPRAVFLRRLIEEHMKRNKEYKS